MALTAYADADHAGCQDTEEAHLKVLSSLEINWLAGPPRNRRALRFLQPRWNTLPYKMAVVSAPTGQAPAMAPPIRIDDQILPCIRWVPIGKSNCYLDLEKSQGNPIYKIVVDLLKNTNFFRAFTASSTIPSIYIQKFWDTIQYDKTFGCYRIWEEFTQSIHTFIEDKRNLSWHTTGKKKATLIVILCIRFTKLIIHYLQRRHRFQPRLDSLLHLPNEEPVLGYLKFSAKGTKRKDSPALKPTKPARKPKSRAPKVPPRPSVSILVTSAQPAPTSAPAKPKERKHKQATETSDKPPKAKKSKYSRVGKIRSLKSIAASKAEDVPAMEPQVAAKDTDLQKALEESMKTAYALPKGPIPPVVIREPESGKYQPLSEVSGKDKAKVTEEQVAHDLLSLQKPKRKSPTDRYIFQRRVSKPTRSSGHDDSPYVVLGQSNSKEESEKVVLGADEGGQGEGQARPHPGAQAEDQTGSDVGTQDKGQVGSNPEEIFEGQAGPDPGNTGADEHSIPSPMVHAGSDREHMELDVADVSPQPTTEQLDEGFTATAYLKVQENLKLTVEEHVLLEDLASSSETLSSLQHQSKEISFKDLFFSDKPSDADKNVKTKVESMVNVSIQQDMSSVSLMTSPIIDLTSRPKSLKPHPPPPPAGLSGASTAPGASGSSQQPLPPPPSSSTNQEKMDEDMGPDEQAQLLDDEDIRSAHIPKVNLRQDWWKPLEKERPATPEPAWSISSFDALVPLNNWASALASNYSPPFGDSLLAQTGLAFEIVKVFHPDVIHLQYQMEDCHKLLTDSMDDPILRNNVSKPLPLGGLPVMSADSTVTYSFVHSEARSLSIPSEDPYEEAAQQLFEQAPHSLEYVPRDHVPVFVTEFEHPEDLVPAEDEGHASLLPPGFLSPRIRPLSPRALKAEMNAIASSLYHSLHPSGTPPLLPIPLGVRSERVLLLPRDGQDLLWLMELIAVMWRLGSEILREG
nr:hypothetical protein [Tanacetum cinerariifolium]